MGEDLLAVDGNVPRRFDADPNLVAVDLHHRHDDVAVDDDLLVQLAAQNQHGLPPCVTIPDVMIDFGFPGTDPTRPLSFPERREENAGPVPRPPSRGDSSAASLSEFWTKISLKSGPP